MAPIKIRPSRAHLKIDMPSVLINPVNYHLTGAPVTSQSKTVHELADWFADPALALAFAPEAIVYSVQSWLPVPPGTAGGLYFGTSTVMPGQVGAEYFMTKGHFHAQGDRSEFYWGVQGQGFLLLMDRARHSRAEKVFPGSLHYIPAETAHRLVNSGKEPLKVAACWPADAGYDYEEISRKGFSARMMEINGLPQLIPNGQ